MPTALWLVLVIVVLVLVANYVQEAMVRMVFYVLAVAMAIYLVWTLIGG